MTGITALPAAGHSFPITTYIPPTTMHQQGGGKNPSVQTSYSVQAMPGGAFTTIFAPGTSVQLGQSIQQGQQQGSVQVTFCSVSKIYFSSKPWTETISRLTIGDLVLKETVCCFGGKVKH